ncbi:unnamed protein product [Parnassius mnemosyne]|uniref:Uncharacterized protein n=1 Tax=Parnassius mnemosyne TaxID=213953 RepID=A0AAV1KWH8_9NEOP
MLSEGQTACFNDLDNNRLSIKFENMYNIGRYSKLYDTSSYNITNTMTWNCYGSGKCWYGSECGNGYKLNTLEKNSTNPNGYGCHMSSVSCNGLCTHGVSCVWYRWEVLPNMNNVAKVYHSVSELWESTLVIIYKNISRTVVFNTNNPTFDLHDILNYEMSHMPVNIHSVTYEKPLNKHAIVEYKNNYYNLDVSPHNLPIANMIGDIQISDDKKVIFHTDNIVVLIAV